MSFSDRGFCKPETALALMKHSDRVFPLFFIEEADVRHTAHSTRPWLPSDAKKRDAMYLADAGSLNVTDWWRWFLPPSIRARWYFKNLKTHLGAHFDFGQPIDVCIDVEGFFRGMYNARLRDQSIESDTREMEASDHAAAHLDEMETLAHEVVNAANAEDIAIRSLYWYGTMRAATNNPTSIDPWPIISSSKLYHPTQAIYPRADWDIIAAMEARIAFLHSETHWQGDKRYFIRPYTLDEAAVHCYAEAINAARPVEIICWDNMRQPGIGADWQEAAVRTILEATE